MPANGTFWFLFKKRFYKKKQLNWKISKKKKKKDSRQLKKKKKKAQTIRPIECLQMVCWSSQLLED